MIRDEKMRLLVPDSDETICPFVQHVQSLFVRDGISTILVMGGSSDYFGAASLVLQMKSFLPVNATKRAKEIAMQSPKPASYWTSDFHRRIQSAPSVRDERGKQRIKVFGTIINYGECEIQVGLVEQIPDRAVSYAIGHALAFVFEKMQVSGATIKDVMRELDALLDKPNGLDHLTPYPDGNLKRPRMMEVVAAMNRMRGLMIKQ